MWPEVPGRTLPVATYIYPLGPHFAAADLRSHTVLVASQPLRVVLVVERSLVADGGLAALEARFPQAGAWRSVPLPAGSAVAITAADLAPARGGRR